jgi:hypothetical protein
MEKRRVNRIITPGEVEISSSRRFVAGVQWEMTARGLRSATRRDIVEFLLSGLRRSSVTFQRSALNSARGTNFRVFFMAKDSGNNAPLNRWRKTESHVSTAGKTLSGVCLTGS